MRKIIILVIGFSVLLLTCMEDFVSYDQFWVADFSGSFQTFYKISAQLLAGNDLCYVWAEKGSGVTEAAAQKVADSYKYDIYNKMLNAFGYKIKVTDKNGKELELNNVQYVNWIVKGDAYDGKLTILLLDIKDNYRPKTNDSYIAGYFWAGNIFETRYSNKCDILYVDTKPGVPGSRSSNETLSHEMQHMMNFTGAARRGSPTDLWIDEGLSVTAEWVFLEEHSSQRMNWYNEKYNKDGNGKEIKGLIDNGNNFFVWGNRENENQYAVLDDYSTVYLFFQWLGLQSDKKIYWKINASNNNDYNAVINAFNDTVLDNKYSDSDWAAMLKDWLAANYFKDSTGRYGYKEDTELNNIKIHYAPGGSTTIDLFPGEAVYSYVIGSLLIPTPAAGNIKYAGLTGSAPVDSGYLSNGALLTYNVNKNKGDAQELGAITGVTPPSAPRADITLGGRSSGIVSSKTVIGPFPISGSDMLRRNGNRSGFDYDGINFKIPDDYRGIIVNE